MGIDLNTIPAIPSDLNYQEIPLGVDPIPYQQLSATGRYPQHVMPDTLPPFLSVLSSTDRQMNPDLLSTDGKRNLNVNIASGGASGGGGPAVMSLLPGAGQAQDINVTFRFGPFAIPSGILYGINYWVYSTGGNDFVGGGAWFQIQVYNPSGTGVLNLATGVLSTNAQNANGQGSISDKIIFPNGIDLQASWGSKSFTVQINNASLTGFWGIQYYC